MNGSHRAKALAALLLCLFLVPALALFSTVYLMSDVDAQWRALAAEESKTPGSDRFTTQAERLAACRSGSPAQALPSTSVDAHRRACAATNEVVWVRRLSAACVALGALMVASIYGARAFAGTNRRRMSQVFGPVVRWTMILLAMSTLAQAGLFIYGLLLVEVAVLHGIHIGIVVAGIAGALLSGLALLRVALAALSDAPLNLPARRLERADHPALFALVDGIAARLQSDPPQHIVLGLDPVFFVTTADLVLAETSDRALLRGSTLYLSLCLMRVFTVDELATVIGHEFGHLRGEDLDYSQKFAPMYARLRRALDNFNQPAGLAAEIGRIPAIAALAACESEFAAAERAVGRQRELLADRAGADVVDAMTLGRALVKSALLAGQWDILTHQHLDGLSRGQDVPRVSESYALLCVAFVASLKWPVALAKLEDRVQPHPVDTHPRLVDRMQGLGLTLTAFERIELSIPTDSAAGLLSGADVLDAELSRLRGLALFALSSTAAPLHRCTEHRRPEQQRAPTTDRLTDTARLCGSLTQMLLRTPSGRAREWGWLNGMTAVVSVADPPARPGRLRGLRRRVPRGLALGAKQDHRIASHSFRLHRFAAFAATPIGASVKSVQRRNDAAPLHREELRARLLLQRVHARQAADIAFVSLDSGTAFLRLRQVVLHFSHQHGQPLAGDDGVGRHVHRHGFDPGSGRFSAGLAHAGR